MLTNHLPTTKKQKPEKSIVTYPPLLWKVPQKGGRYSCDPHQGPHPAKEWQFTSHGKSPKEDTWMMSMVVSWNNRYNFHSSFLTLYPKIGGALHLKTPLAQYWLYTFELMFDLYTKKTFVKYSIMFNQKKEHEDASIWHLQFGGPECSLLRSPAKQNWKGKSVHDLSSLGLLS